ncbi:SMP-30/gluconolactonase/LRE family protein [Actinokineospora bangkokensis]|uniref:SMP-30/Gluconolactonase/LRE-like region domain-containing protein n=1 Tax=Actinokineospora bangkokensis TaxID=1193682 RepID=A0A1Q9LMV4_9PSEU|nr:SMP-30/gluconolactonase/LRE family protein [Actinokineospora bangkokensis]OLR93329.1 hypothetical protein BJP25_17810 [Actinokineospora bangkokensis]
MSTPTPATTEVHRLAEGPFWDAARERLLWVDIEAGAVLMGALDGGALRVLERHGFDGMVGAVVAAEDGTLLVAGQESLVVQHLDGSREVGPRIVPSGARRRLNDGSTDPAGRFLVGTLPLGDPSESEVLVRVDGAGVTEIDADLTLSNGLAWSPDGSRMYSVDTERQLVYVREYDAATGETGERRVHLRLERGHPDGIAMDAEEHLWVAVWGEGEVRRYSPTGEVVERLRVPAPHSSCVAFAGPDLRTLVITTGTSQLDDEQLAAHPDSGRLFTARVDVPGVPVPYWAGF